jgi:hypothetical protein
LPVPAKPWILINLSLVVKISIAALVCPLVKISPQWITKT